MLLGIETEPAGDEQDVGRVLMGQAGGPRLRSRVDLLEGACRARPGAQPGGPLVDEALAWLECNAERFIPAGDHTLIIGSVLDGAVLREGEPLTQRVLGWSYGG